MHECNQCGKAFGKKENLYTHIRDTHREDIVYHCPICSDKNYNSQGSFYKHLRTQHNIWRDGIKLSDFIKSETKEDPKPINLIDLSTDQNTTNTDNTEPIQPKEEHFDNIPAPEEKQKKAKQSSDNQNNAGGSKPSNENKGCKRSSSTPENPEILLAKLHSLRAPLHGIVPYVKRKNTSRRTIIINIYS